MNGRLLSLMMTIMMIASALAGCAGNDVDVDLDDEDGNDESETYELLVSFLVDEQEYGLYIPLDPFFVVARMDDGAAVLVEGEEFDRIQPRIEAELDDRELPE